MSQAGIINLIDNNPTIPIYFEADTGFAVALFNVINIVGTGGIVTSATGNTITIDGSGITPPDLTLTGDTGGPLTPTADNWNIVGGTVAAGTTPVQVNGAVSTLTVNVQRAQAIASTNATNIGLAAFNSAQFTVDSNGFVSAIDNGNVIGPASAVDNDIVIFDGVTGKIIKDTGISSLAPTFVGDVTSLTRMIVPYDTGAAEGMYFSDGSNAFRQVGSALANYFFGNSGNSTLAGIANTGAGQAALVSLTGGIQNTGMGNGALLGVQNGTANCGFGYLAGQGIVDSGSCNAFGVGALSAACGNFNDAFGTLTLQNCLGQNNVAFGGGSLQNLNAGNFNTAIGDACSAGLLTGSNNFFAGYASGNQYNGAESGNILIDNFGVTGESNVIRIGTNQTTCFVAGINGATVTGTAVLCAADGQLGTVVSSARYKENIQDIPDDISIMHLRPVEFNYKGFRKISYGLIAEEVDRDFPYLCFYKEGKPESVKYQELCVFLLREVQRLDARLRDLEQIGA